MAEIVLSKEIGKSAVCLMINQLVEQPAVISENNIQTNITSNFFQG